MRAMVNKTRLNLFLTVLSITLVGGLWFVFVRAAGNATFSLSPSSGSHDINTNFTVNIYEDSSSETVNSVEANLTYDQSKLEFVSVSTSGSPFTTCTPEPSGGGGSVSIVCAKLGGTVTGKQLVGAVRFKALVGSGTTTISFATNSHIIRSPDASDIWNGDTTGGTYTLSTPAPPPADDPPPDDDEQDDSTSTTPPPSANNQTSNTTPPSVEEQQADPEKPVPVSNEAPTQGYFVAIKVLSGQGKAVENATVKLGDMSAQTDATGIASFVGVADGQYDVVATGNGGEARAAITVKASDNPNEVQEFELTLANKFPWIIIEIGVGTLLLAAATVLLYIKKKLPLPWKWFRKSPPPPVNPSVGNPPTPITPDSPPAPTSPISAVPTPPATHPEPPHKPGDIVAPANPPQDTKTIYLQ